MRRSGILALGLVLAAAALVALGRWERDRYSAETSAEMAAVASAVGPSLASHAVTDSYFAGPATCLTYDSGRTEYDIALCFDGAGRLIETTDTRSGTASFDTFRFEPDLARVRVDPSEIQRATRLLDERAAVTHVAGTAIIEIRSCVDWTKEAATAKRAKLATVTGQAARACRDGARTLAAIVRAVRSSPLIDQALIRQVQAAERVLGEAGVTLDAAARRDFGLLRRRQAAIAAHRTVERESVAPLAALQAAVEDVAARPLRPR